MILSTETAELFGIVTEAFAYGLLTVSFPITIYIILRNSPRKSLKSSLLFLCLLMYILPTASFSVDIVRLAQGFLQNSSPTSYYTNASNPLQLAKYVLFEIDLAVFGIFAVYRTSQVWSRNVMVVALLFALLIAGLGIALAAIYFQSMSSNVFASAAEMGWTEVSFIIAALFWTMNTCLMAYGQWMYDHDIVKFLPLRHRRTRGLARASLFILESGAAWSACLVATLVAYLCRSNVQLLFFNALPALAGLCFNSIVVLFSGGFSLVLQDEEDRTVVLTSLMPESQVRVVTEKCDDAESLKAIPGPLEFELHVARTMLVEEARRHSRR